MATHSRILAWRILWTEEPGGCCSWGFTESDKTEVTQHACMHWRRKWQPTPVFLLGESQGQKSLVSCHLWGHTRSDTTEATQQHHQSFSIWYDDSCDYFTVVLCQVTGVSLQFLFIFLSPKVCWLHGDFSLKKMISLLITGETLFPLLNNSVEEQKKQTKEKKKKLVGKMFNPYTSQHVVL